METKTDKIVLTVLYVIFGLILLIGGIMLIFGFINLIKNDFTYVTSERIISARNPIKWSLFFVMAIFVGISGGIGLLYQAHQLWFKLK